MVSGLESNQLSGKGDRSARLVVGVRRGHISLLLRRRGRGRLRRGAYEPRASTACPRRAASSLNRSSRRVRSYLEACRNRPAKTLFAELDLKNRLGAESFGDRWRQR